MMRIDEEGRLRFLGDESGDEFRPLRVARHIAIRGLARQTRLKAAEKQKLGYPDDWLDNDLGQLIDMLNDEIGELRNELFKIVLCETYNIEEAKRECADVAFCAAMIHDKLRSLEKRDDD